MLPPTGDAPVSDVSRARERGKIVSSSGHRRRPSGSIRFVLQTTDRVYALANSSKQARCGDPRRKPDGRNRIRTQLRKRKLLATSDRNILIKSRIVLRAIIAHASGMLIASSLPFGLVSGGKSRWLAAQSWATGTRKFRACLRFNFRLPIVIVSASRSVSDAPRNDRVHDS